MRNFKPTMIALSSSLALSACSSFNEAPNVTVQSTPVPIVINFQTQHQVMHSFGASDAWSINPMINQWIKDGEEEKIQELAEMLFSTDNGIGLSAWRFNIGGGSAEQGRASQIPDEFRRAELLMAEPNGEIDTTKQRGQIRMLQEAQSLGVDQLIAFVNSPPAWATKNGLTYPAKFTDFGDVGSTNLKPEEQQNFINFLVEVMRYLQDEEGIAINHLSPVNEPTWDWEDGTPQEANRYNMEELKSVYLALDTALKAAELSNSVAVDGAEAVEYTAALSDEFKTQFDHAVYTAAMNGRNQGSYKNYIDELLGDPVMNQVLHNKISLHGYWSDAYSDRMGPLRDLVRQNVDQVSPGAEIWMSEICMLGGTGDVRPFEGHGFEADDMELAVHVSRIIHRDLTRLNASAWHWWLAVTPYNYKDGLIKIGNDLNPASLEDSKLMWTLGNYSRFIRPGFQRVELNGVDDLFGLMASAYLSPEADQLVTVVTNAHNNAATTLDFSLEQMSDKQVTSSEVYITNAEHNLELVGEYSADMQIPPMSTVTIVKHLK